MDIAFIFDGLGMGGIERVGIDYIRLLKAAGYSITVYNLKPSANELEKEIDLEIPIKRITVPRELCPYRFFELVNRFSWGKYVFPGVYLVLKVLQVFHRLVKKNIVAEYEYAIAFSGHFNDLMFVAENYIKARNKICWLHGGILDYALTSAGYLMLYKKISNLVTLSSFYEEEVLSANKILQNVRIKKIYNPTYIGEREINDAYVKHLKVQYGEFLLMVGRFTKEKDQYTVIDALKLLKTEQKININLVFLGDGPEKLAVEKYASDQGLSNYVFFEGNRYDIQNYYKAAKLFIHSSPAEGLPTVLLEAMNFGVPIVATNSMPGVPEILEGDKDGLVCAVKDSSKMAEHIGRLLTDDLLYEEYKRRGEIRIEDFRPSKIQEELLAFLDEIRD